MHLHASITSYLLCMTHLDQKSLGVMFTLFLLSALLGIYISSEFKLLLHSVIRAASGKEFTDYHCPTFYMEFTDNMLSNAE